MEVLLGLEAQFLFSINRFVFFFFSAEYVKLFTKLITLILGMLATILFNLYSLPTCYTKNIRIKIYRTIILLLILCWYGTLSLTFKGRK
jgi:hypothetical protein